MTTETKESKESKESKKKKGYNPYAVDPKTINQWIKPEVIDFEGLATLIKRDKEALAIFERERKKTEVIKTGTFTSAVDINTFKKK